ncbi:MAG TPA: type II toxin-antitoxin system RelE/ParE family toxin [Thermoanaerobaculia bacterium]|nr:type II toxin-antitoxin system RelE/ParE family toxin [Thermoanaerobaculia bacterium]
MSRELRLRGAALSDLRRARGWYEREAPHMVDAFLEEFRAVISSIEERPLMYPAIARQVRRALMTRFHYAIYFTAEEETIMVYAILHQARHEGRWKQRLPRER